jgi:hypothetical protein
MFKSPACFSDPAWGAEVSLDFGFDFHNVTVRVCAGQLFGLHAESALHAVAVDLVCLIRKRDYYIFFAALAAA